MDVAGSLIGLASGKRGVINMTLESLRERKTRTPVLWL
jgi:hypothetical protein